METWTHIGKCECEHCKTSEGKVAVVYLFTPDERGNSEYTGFAMCEGCLRNALTLIEKMPAEKTLTAPPASSPPPLTAT